MKYLFKFILRSIIIAFAMNNMTQATAADVTQSSEFFKPAEIKADSTLSTSKFSSANEQTAYALGAFMGRYMGNSLKEQEKLGIKLNKDQLIAGVQDVFANNAQLSDADIEKTLQRLEADVKIAAQAKMEYESKENGAEGVKYSEAFAKEKGVNKAESGLLYQVELPGSGVTPKDSDVVVVNYRGAFTNGIEFDNSYIRGKPLSFRLDSVIPGWTEGLKHIKKGGRIKLVIPPALAYGKNSIPGIPVNSTLVFDIELLDVKVEPQSENKPMKLSNAQLK